MRDPARFVYARCPMFGRRLIESALFALLLSTVSALPLAAIERQVVLTFDDLPAQRGQALPEEQIASILPGLIDTLTRTGAPAIGFVNEIKLEVDGSVDPERVSLLEQWLDAGLELGNHSYSHPDLHRVALDYYYADILGGERVTRRLVEARGRELHFFRHPFLHTGTDLDTKHAVEQFLAEHSYRVAPVTIDNSEWIFARAYDEALERGDTDLQEELGATYVSYMEAMVEYYEGQSRTFFNREIPQILLLHANALNRDHLAALLDALRWRRYTFIDLPTALADAAYASENTYVGPGGITWIHRWAISEGVDPQLFRGEPTCPEWVQELAGLRE